MPIKYNTEIFIQLSKKTHGNKYDYKLVKYLNNHTKVKIICPEHGLFEQTPQVHIKGGNCSICSYNNNSKKFSMGKDIFIKKSKEIHGDKYDYSLVKYINQREKVKIVCPEHGIFEQTPKSHYNNKSGCPICSGSYKSDTNDFINKSKKTHDDNYIYDKVNYKNAITKVIITCKLHGDFLITPNNHLSGKGCPICKMSHGEQKIKTYLINNNITYVRQKTFEDCKLKRLLRFDFFIPKYNIIIEYDGEQHFKKFRFETSNHNLELRKIKDDIKNKYCINNNIKLYRITYKDNINDFLEKIF